MRLVNITNNIQKQEPTQTNKQHTKTGTHTNKQTTYTNNMQTTSKCKPLAVIFHAVCVDVHGLKQPHERVPQPQPLNHCAINIFWGCDTILSVVCVVCVYVGGGGGGGGGCLCTSCTILVVIVQSNTVIHALNRKQRSIRISYSCTYTCISTLACTCRCFYHIL